MKKYLGLLSMIAAAILDYIVPLHTPDVSVAIAPVIIAAIISGIAGLAGAAMSSNASSKGGAQSSAAAARQGLQNMGQGNSMDLSGGGGTITTPMLESNRLRDKLRGSGYGGL